MVNHMVNDNATPLAEILAQTLRQTGLERKLHEQAVLDSWEAVVGEQVARATQSKKFEMGGRLVVQMVSAVWRYEIMMRREEIRIALNQHHHSRVSTGSAEFATPSTPLRELVNEVVVR
jgi:predicted nucleic acid-binding Zn ribbon protein